MQRPLVLHLHSELLELIQLHKEVRQNQAVPTSPGVMQGQKPQQKTDIDNMWDGMVKAGGRSNVL